MSRKVALLVTLLLVATGSWLMWRGFHQPPEEAPQVERPVVAAPDQTPVGPSEAPVKSYPPEEAKAENTVMSPEAMAPNRVFIPSLGVYGAIDRATGALEAGFLTLPSAEKVTQWEGGSKVTSSEGNILIAGHVSWNGEKGLLHDMAYLKAGELAYITDEKGHRQAFQLKTLTTVKKSSLPQEIWATTGPKQLVMVTCGGSIYRTSSGALHFDSNVISTFVPVG